ncbi:MAG: DUF3570 domain-containing protein [Myxococcales bacterium FL481]|nr:MAG: DUF3570 domain-containing protein [Myxococcales bacterium FL481]
MSPGMLQRFPLRRLGRAVAVAMAASTHCAATSTPAPTSSGAAGTEPSPASLSGALYVRTDTDQTTVVSPLVHFRSDMGTAHVNIDIVYMADIWTSASVDVRTAATKVVREQRDEVDVGLDLESGLARAGLGYRYSHEVDYLSNSISLFAQYEAFQRSTTFAARASFAADQVGRSGDEFFSRELTTVGAWIGITQVLSRTSLAQISYEHRYSHGYMASPYRYVAINGQGVCRPGAEFCLPEVHPNVKVRQAAVLRFRQALGGQMSLGGGYRLYLDSWQIRSHTALADVGLAATDNWTLSLYYRGYRQNEAFFYRRQYDSIVGHPYLTRDRELSELSSHQGGLRAEYVREIPATGSTFTFGVLAALTRYAYGDFIGLDRVRGTEIGSTVGLTY